MLYSSDRLNPTEIRRFRTILFLASALIVSFYWISHGILSNTIDPLWMRVAVGARYRDMPPFKACTVGALEQLALSDTGHGFTIELMMKAYLAKLRVVEVEVCCRVRRAGVSKVSGTARGASRAAVKIVTTIARYAAARRR